METSEDVDYDSRTVVGLYIRNKFQFGGSHTEISDYEGQELLVGPLLFENEPISGSKVRNNIQENQQKEKH